MQENDLSILSDISKTLSENPAAGQREIAKKSSLSLGMTNALLRRFAEKGWILMNRISARNIRYVLTPEGMNELARRSYHYMKRTFGELRDFYDTIGTGIRRAKKAGNTAAVLYGKSDIAFIIESVCRRENIPFTSVSPLQCSDRLPMVPEGTLGSIAESVCPGAEAALREQGCVSVYELAGKER
jgi:DNA-binding MarR family transcriptional regulator